MRGPRSGVGDQRPEVETSRRAGTAVLFDPHDTIVAVATPPGGALRGIVRLSGPQAWEIVAPLVQPPLPIAAADFRPQALSGRLSLPVQGSGFRVQGSGVVADWGRGSSIPTVAPQSGFNSSTVQQVKVPAHLYLSRAPRSYTGQDLVEVHTLGSPPILDLALETFVSRGARQAIAGEFTMRAFLNGKLDLTEAEAVLGLIDASTSHQTAVALRQMAGGIARPVQRLRDQLLDLLAELEAGLDFAEEDLEFIDRNELQVNLRAVSDELQRLDQQMQGRTLCDDRRRAVLVGLPNVGKSALFNALLGRDAALVSQIAGTTRDYLIGQLQIGDCVVEIVDTAGMEAARDAISHQAQAVRDQIAGDADLLLWCLDSRVGQPLEQIATGFPQRTKQVLFVRTKCDLVQPGDEDSYHSPLPTPHSPVIAVSALTGAGLAELRAAIAQWVRGSDEGTPEVVASTAVRCRQAIASSEAAIARALAAAQSKANDELVALELRLALDELGQVVGAVYTDDILDRIFSRFCIGK